MNDLIGRLVADIGVDRSAADKAGGRVMQFRLQAGPTANVRAPAQRMSGCNQYRADAATTSLRLPSAIAGLMAVGGQMTAGRPGMVDIEKFARESMRLARENAGEDAGDKNVGAVPSSARWSDVW